MTRQPVPFALDFILSCIIGKTTDLLWRLLIELKIRLQFGRSVEHVTQVRKNIIISPQFTGYLLRWWPEAYDKNWYKCHSSRRKPVSFWMFFFPLECGQRDEHTTVFYPIVNDHTSTTQSAKNPYAHVGYYWYHVHGTASWNIIPTLWRLEFHDFFPVEIKRRLTSARFIPAFLGNYILCKLYTLNLESEMKIRISSTILILLKHDIPS